MTTNDSKALHELQKDMGKVLTIVSDLAVGQKRLEERMVGVEGRLTGVEGRLEHLENDMSEVKEKLDQVIEHSTMNYEKNKFQDKRLDRIETHLGLPCLTS